METTISYTVMFPKGCIHPIVRYLGLWVLVILVQVLGKDVVLSIWTLRGCSLCKFCVSLPILLTED